MPRGLDYSQDLKGIHLALAGASKSLHNGLIFELEELIFKGKYCKVFGQQNFITTPLTRRHAYLRKYMSVCATAYCHNGECMIYWILQSINVLWSQLHIFHNFPLVFPQRFFFTRSQWQSCIKVNGPVVSCGGEVDKPVEGNRKI